MVEHIYSGKAKRRGRPGLAVLEWNNAADMCNGVDATMRVRGPNASDEWYLGKHYANYVEAQEACKLGIVKPHLWEQYCERRDSLEPAIAEFMHTGVTTRRKRRYGDDGAEVNIDRVATHNPECWEYRKRGAKKQLIVLGVQYQYSWMADESTFVRNATLAAAASDVLERLGYGVTIVGLAWGDYTDYLCGEWDGWRMISSVVLKQSHEPLDAERVLTMGIPAFSRAFLFGTWEAYATRAGEWNMFLGKLTDNEFKALGIDAFIGQDFTNVVKGGKLQHSDRLEGFFNNMVEELS